VLPPGIDWGQLSFDGLIIPPTDRVPPASAQLHEPPLPNFAAEHLTPHEPAASQDNTVADTLGHLVDRPRLNHRAGRATPAPRAAKAPSTPAVVSTASDSTTDIGTSDSLVTPPNWLDQKLSRRSSDALSQPTDNPPPVAGGPPADLDPQRFVDTAAEIASELAAEMPPPEVASGQPAALVATPPARSLRSALTPSQLAEMAAVSRLADGHSKRGFELAGRNALYSARAEFVQALAMIAQGLDAIEQHTARIEAMTGGLLALEESDQFVSHSSKLSTNFDAVIVARPHKTPVLKDREPGTTSAMQALQLYYGYAQRQLEFASGRQPAASMALHGLGKVYAALAKTKGRSATAAEPKAIVFFQAALLADARNYLAANELGVLLASYGKYPQAKAAFLQSLRVSGQPVTWRNLAVVHAHLRESELAQLALREAQLAVQRGVDRQPGPLGLTTRPFDMQWVDPNTFAQVPDQATAPAQKPGEPERPAVTSMPPRPSTPARR
jgi:tetratricopeptide (TPR) repeat protein